jgi:DUF1680 family protein
MAGTAAQFATGAAAGSAREKLTLDNDRLLKVNRQKAGLPAPGDDMGGWYDAIRVNLFTPSAVQWQAGRIPVKRTQETNYPLEETKELRVEVPSPAEFSIHVRVPGWLAAQPRLELNGKPLDVPVRRSTFASIRRRWRNNDTITMCLPLGFMTEPVDDHHPTLVALARGPLMYVAANPSADLSTTPLPPTKALLAVSHGAGGFEARVPDRAGTNCL